MQAAIAQAAEILRAGGIVAFPTETVYGLGADATNSSAVQKIFMAKERPAWDPLIVHVSDEAMLRRVARFVPERAQPLMEAFWPGPLTMLLEKSDAVASEVTAGLMRVGVRMPKHPVAQALIRTAGLPLAAPSANRFGRISPTTADHVLQDLDGRIDAVIDAGPCPLGVESTVLDVCESPMVLYRPGAVTAEQIAALAGEVRVYRPEVDETAETSSLIAGSASPGPGVASPGLEVRHYAPRAKLLLADSGDGDEGWRIRLRMLDLLHETVERGQRAGLMLPQGWEFAPEDLPLEKRIFHWGSWESAESLAKGLFAGLRYLDSLGVDVIICPLPNHAGLGAALQDRLRKAAQS